MRRFFSLVNLPGSSHKEPKEIGIWGAILGSIVVIFLSLLGWHIINPGYIIPWLSGDILIARERENTLLSEKLQRLNQLDTSLQAHIQTLSEKAADINDIVHGANISSTLNSSNSLSASIESIDIYNSSHSVIVELHSIVDLMLQEAREELLNLKAIELKSKDNSFWTDIPIVLPVVGPISRTFGSPRNLLSESKRVHGGLDIAAHRNESVRATANGVVSRTGVNRSLGKYIEIVHKNGYTTRYGHLAKVLIKRRDRVQRGRVIGVVGKTGKTNGYHVHYEILYKGRILNPSNWSFPDK